MKKLVTMLVCALGLVAGIATAQVAGGSTVGVTVVEQEKILMGWSAKRELLGKSVMNDQKEKIGKVEDLIVAPDKSVSAAIISTGGFLGMGKHDVAIPTTQLKMNEGQLMLPGGSKDALKALPEFDYAKQNRHSGS